MPADQPTAAEITKFRRLVDAIGVPAAVAKFGIARDPLLRILAGQPVRRGTLHMLRAILKEKR